MNSFVKLMTTSIKESENIKLREKQNMGEKRGGFRSLMRSDEQRGGETTANAV